MDEYIYLYDTAATNESLVVLISMDFDLRKTAVRSDLTYFH